jgi:hypothetical protein
VTTVITANTLHLTQQSVLKAHTAIWGHLMTHHSKAESGAAALPSAHHTLSGATALDADGGKGDGAVTPMQRVWAQHVHDPLTSEVQVQCDLEREHKRMQARDKYAAGFGARNARILSHLRLRRGSVALGAHAAGTRLSTAMASALRGMHQQGVIPRHTLKTPSGEPVCAGHAMETA